MSYADIDAGIKSIGTRTTKLRDDIHKIAVSILVRWEETGDAGTAAAKATSLLANVDKYKAQPIVNWFSIYAGFAYSSDTQAFSYTNTTITLDVEKGTIYINGDDKGVKTYWELSPPPKTTSFDLMGRLQALIAQAEKRAAKPKDGDEIDPEVVNKLKELMKAD